MPTDRYIVEEQILVQHQAGDTGDIVFEVPAAISLIGRVVKFAVLKGSSIVIFSKTQPVITVSGQFIIIPMLVADTEGISGEYKWELEISVPNTPMYATIGQGTFEILKTYIPSV